MATTYGDNFEFNLEQLSKQIELLEDIRTTIANSKEKYEEYINRELRPNWTTEAGTKTVEELIKFSNTEIKNFITYLDNRIGNLRNAHEQALRVNKA